MYAIIINLIFSIAAAVGTVALGLAFKEFGAFKFSIPYLWSLATNKWFILALVFGFGSVFLRYAILKVQGVGQSSYYLQTSLIAVLVLSHFVLGEQFGIKLWIGATMILIGAFVMGLH